MEISNDIKNLLIKGSNKPHNKNTVNGKVIKQDHIGNNSYI